MDNGNKPVAAGVHMACFLGVVMTATPRVVSLTGAEIIPPGTPKPDLIALAEEILERARSGDLAGLSVVLKHADDTHSYRHHGPVAYATIGCIETLKAWMVEDIASR